MYGGARPEDDVDDEESDGALPPGY